VLGNEWLRRLRNELGRESSPRDRGASEPPVQIVGLQWLSATTTANVVCFDGVVSEACSC
jgi:hypothetical protein